MRKILIFVLVAVIFLASCTAEMQNEHLFCKKLGFDITRDGKIYITVYLTSSGKDTPEKDGAKLVTRTADDVHGAIQMLENEFVRILFKPLEEIIFGQTVDRKTERKLMEMLVNQSEFQLKCKIRRESSAYYAIKENDGASENEAVIFSSYFRNMKGEGE